MPTTEYTRPGGPVLAPDDHLLHPLLDRHRRDPQQPVAGVREGDRFVDVTLDAFLRRVRGFAKGLIALGVEPGDRVALMSHTRLEWLELDYAILMAGAVTVPIYETSSAEQVRWIIGDSEAVLAVVETPEHRATFDVVAPDLPGCRRAFTIDQGELAELVALGRDVDDATVDRRVAGIGLEDLATIIYTSGTTGRPKGCVLTHANLRANVLQSLGVFRPYLEEHERSLLFLPLAHSLAKIITLFFVEAGIQVNFATDLEHLVEELPLARPTIVVAVPRIFEKVFTGARRKAEADGKGAIFDRAADVAGRWSAQRAADHLTLGTRLQHALFDRLVYGKLRALFGGELRMAVSGGGPLGERLSHFFHGVGVQVLEGYGLTETSPVLSVNVPDAWSIGTAGLPVPGTSIRIAADGEIQAKGPQVFQGYWHNQTETDAVFTDDGWFRTGDLGVLEDGYVRITGRVKDLIVTAAGKNVAPAPLEDRLRAHPLVSQAMVVGEGRPYVAALLAVDEEAFAFWADQHGLRGASVADHLEEPALLEELQQAVDAANASVSRAESIRRFAVLPEDLAIETGELTPTLKVRRNVLEKRYSDRIEALYR